MSLWRWWNLSINSKVKRSWSSWQKCEFVVRRKDSTGVLSKRDTVRVHTLQNCAHLPTVCAVWHTTVLMKLLICSNIHKEKNVYVYGQRRENLVSSQTSFSYSISYPSMTFIRELNMPQISAIALLRCCVLSVSLACCGGWQIQLRGQRYTLKINVLHGAIEQTFFCLMVA